MSSPQPARILVPAVLFLVLCLPVPLWAGAYPFVEYDHADGLPSSAVLDVAQDERGYMWFATRLGLVRYDGAEWTGIENDPDESFSGYHHVEFDAAGRLWATSLSTRLQVYYRQDETWHRLPDPGLEAWGLDALDFAVCADATQLGPVLVSVRRGPLILFDGRRWRDLSTGTDLGPVFDIERRRQDFWLVAESGLYVLPVGQFAPKPVPLPGRPDGRLVAVAVTHDGAGLWLVGQGWLGQLRDGELEVLCEDPNLILPDANNGVAVTADIVGGLFFGDSRAVFAYHPATGLEVIDRTSGRSPVGVLSLLTDREGTVWFTAYRGVSKLPGRSLVSYDRRHGLLGDEVTALLERPDGTWFLGHNDGLTILGSQPRRLRFPVQGGHYGRVMDFEIDLDGRVWIAADRLGLAWLDNDSTFVWAGPETGLRGPVSSVKCDRQGRLWVACQSGLYRRQGDRFVAALIPDSDFERGNGVRRIELAADGSLLVATARSGLFRVHGEDVRRFAAPPHSPYNSAFAALELDDGRVWVGTAAGLCSVVGDSLVATRAPDPVVDRPIYALLRDGRGDVWLGTDNGVRIWDGRTLRTLTFVEGLIGKETNRDALVADSAGRIWIGQDRGVTVYDRRLDAAPLGAPQVELAGIAVGDQILSGYDEMTVGAPISSLVVRFRGLSYRLEPLTYRTWLEPFESDWQPPRQVPRRLIRYDDVPPGSYRFHIQAIRGDGVASEVCTSGLLVIEPPVWRRPWFVILAAAVVLFVLWSLVSTLASRSAARKLEREVAERTAALQASETELRAQSGRLATILGSISDGLLAVDDSRTVVLCNEAAVRLLDRVEPSIEGENLADLLPELAEAVDAAVAGRAPDESDGGAVCCRSRDGGEIWLEFSVAPLAQIDDPLRGLVVAFRDVTDRRRAENELVRSQRLESLGVLAGGLAHDFNNLLTIILGNLSLVEMNDGLMGDDQERLAQVRQATERAQGLTRQLLTFSRGGAPQRRHTRLQDLIEPTVALSLSGTKVNWTCDLADDLWTADIDPGQIEQVLSNLLINAGQAMPDGGTVCVRARNRELPDDAGDATRYAVIEIQDHGCGISADDRERIFEPYFTTKDTGSGLGLAIAFSIVKRHGGRLDVVSEPGRGSIFSLALPATVGEPVRILPEAAARLATGGRILVLDDDEQIRNVVEAMLKRMGFEAALTSDGHQTVAAFAAAVEASDPFRAVIVDLTIPGGMGGEEVLPELRRIDSSVPVIVASGYSHSGVMAAYRDHGFNGCLAKPYDNLQLARVLADVLPDEPARLDQA